MRGPPYSTHTRYIVHTIGGARGWWWVTRREAAGCDCCALIGSPNASEEASRLAGSRAARIPALRAYTAADTSVLSHARSLGLRSLGLHARRRPAVAPPLPAEPASRTSHPTALGDVSARSEKTCLSAESYFSVP